MKKTPVSARFAQQLINANDQVCFSALQQWEFRQTLAPLVAARPEDFTPSMFPANPFAQSIFRKLRELPTFSQEAQQIALRMGVIASVEYILAYLEEVQDFRQSIVASDVDNLSNDAEEEQLRLKVERWSGTPPTSGHFRTVGYLRHLRNHYSHVNDQPHAAFSTYVRSHGTPLNSFWNNGITDLHGIDFRTLSMAPLTPELTFGIMNVLRVSLQHIDDAVASTLPFPDVVRWLLGEVLRSPQNRQRRQDRIASKVRARLDMEWNIQASSEVVESEVQRILEMRS